MFYPLVLFPSERVSNWIKAIESNSESEHRFISDYLTFYNLDFTNVTHKLYFLNDSCGKKIFVHEMLPSEIKGRLVFLHGYLSHSGLFSHFYRHFLEIGYHIVAVDLPGHGLSEGVRTGVDDFSQYAKVVKLIYDLFGSYEGNIFFIGHSTGCAALLEFIHNYGIYPSRMIFLSPLVRIILWDMATFGYNLFGRALRYLPRIRKESSYDEEYLDFIYNKDPIRYEWVDLSWFRATYEWNKRILNYPQVTNVRLMIIQGEEDDVVDWKYNVVFLTNMFVNSSLFFIKNAKHDILNERRDIREKVFSILEREIDSK